jgi:hypothetical protein
VDDVTLTKTVCQVLADRTPWAWRPDGPSYAADEIGIHYGALPPEPDQAVGVSLYYIDDPRPGDDAAVQLRRVQIRMRGERGALDGADELAQVTFTALHRLTRTAGLSLVTRVLVAHLGADENDRQERADSYQIILDNPEASA